MHINDNFDHSTYNKLLSIYCFIFRSHCRVCASPVCVTCIVIKKGFEKVQTIKLGLHIARRNKNIIVLYFKKKDFRKCFYASHLKEN